ncbi:MAG: CRISPR-associated endonuclease Cas2 [Proteobacteria bacterium]|nr:CRISPR-associated endonuclease Cas2 [Pseudomonadota bacterium]
MFILVVYDVTTKCSQGQKRLRRVAKTCEDFGIRVQNSVFECRLNMANWVTFKHRLLNEINTNEDSLRFYFLHEDNQKKTEHHGCKEPIDITEPLIF